MCPKEKQNVYKKNRASVMERKCCRMALNLREKLFVEQFIILGNAYRAALEAGYKEKTALYASKWINESENPKKPGAKSKFKPEVRAAIDARMAEKDKELIADQDEVLKYLTSVLRGKSRSSVIVVESTGDYCSEAREMEKAPDEKERLKAAELLGKRYGLYTDRIEQDVDMELNISIDYGEENED